MASIKMGWQDWRLLLPSILTVVSNFFFAILLFVQGNAKIGGQVQGVAQTIGQSGQNMMKSGSPEQFMQMTGLNGPADPSGFGQMVGAGTDMGVVAMMIVAVWWLTNRFLEGVTTALVYCHLTEGAGTGKMNIACQEVLRSLPALIMLGITTLLAKTIARGLRGKGGTGGMGFGVDFLAGIVAVFWTLAGHLILPAIVIEGTSFWGALKRADRMALLNGADLPLRGLSVEDGALTYKGKHWRDMSGSDQLRVAAAIVRRLNPDCGFVLLDKLEQMDMTTLQEFSAWLEAEGLQAIATRVSTGSECQIIIEDGMVKDTDITPPPVTEKPQPKSWTKGAF